MVSLWKPYDSQGSGGGWGRCNLPWDTCAWLASLSLSCPRWWEQSQAGLMADRLSKIVILSGQIRIYHSPESCGHLGIIPLTNHHLWWGCSEVVIICSDTIQHEVHIISRGNPHVICHVIHVHSIMRPCFLAPPKQPRENNEWLGDANFRDMLPYSSVKFSPFLLRISETGLVASGLLQIYQWWEFSSYSYWWMAWTWPVPEKKKRPNLKRCICN